MSSEMDGGEPPGFWRWLVLGSGNRPGYRHVIDGWLLAHIAIGGALAVLIDAPLSNIASKSIIPLVSVLVGLTFAWVGNANSLLSTHEIDRLSELNPGGFADYVYAYQLAILVVLSTLIFWASAAIVLDVGCFGPITNSIMEVSLYAWTSLAVRECWGVVNGAQFMLMTRRRVQKLENAKQSSNENNAE